MNVMSPTNGTSVWARRAPVDLLPSTKLCTSARSWISSWYLPSVRIVHVLSLRVGEVDREPRADRSDEERQVVGVRRRRSGRRRGRAAGDRGATPCAWLQGRGPEASRSTDSLNRGSERRVLDLRAQRGRRFVDGASLRARRRRGRRGRVRLFAAAGERAQPARPGRAEASRPPARVGAGDAAPPAVAPARDLRAVVPLPLGDPGLPASGGGHGLRRVRASSSRGCAASAPTSSRSSCCGRSTTTAAARVRRGAASCRHPRCEPLALKRAGVHGAAAPGAPRRSSSTTRRGSSSASPRSSRATGRKRSRRSGSGSSRGWPRASRSPGAQIAADGLHPFLLSLAPQLRVDPGGRSFGLDIPHDHRVPVGARNPLLLVPSVYVWPHVRVNCDAPWPLTVIYRAPHLVAGLRRATPPQLVQLLKALADPTRLRILELVAQRPRSTQELAPLVGLTDAGASKQLRLLAGNGPPVEQARGLLRRLLPRAREAGDVVRRARPPRRA